MWPFQESYPVFLHYERQPVAVENSTWCAPALPGPVRDLAATPGPRRPTTSASRACSGRRCASGTSRARPTSRPSTLASSARMFRSERRCVAFIKLERKLRHCRCHKTFFFVTEEAKYGSICLWKAVPIWPNTSG